MEAGRVVCPFFGVVFGKLKSLIDNDRKRLRPLVGMVKDQLKKLKQSFCRINDVLDDAEEKQLDEEAVQLWLEELNDASYEADDVFDECEYYGGLQQPATEEASSSSTTNKKVQLDEAAVQLWLKYYGGLQQPATEEASSSSTTNKKVQLDEAAVQLWLKFYGGLQQPATEEASSSSSSSTNKKVQLDEAAFRLWLEELNDASYEADDVFDECEYYGGLQQPATEEASSSSSTNKKVQLDEAAFRLWLEELNDASYEADDHKKVTEQQLSEKVQKLIVKFQVSVDRCSELGLQKRKGKRVGVSAERLTISLSTERQIYGRDGDREKLVMQLLGSAYLSLDQFHGQIYKHPKGIQGAVQNNQGNISVIPILGMGGLGKTTLAQFVYNDKRVENHFKDRAWVCVSDDFDIKRLMKAIIASFSGSECNDEGLELLQQRLRKEVHGKRFLLVLDDIWEESQEEWEKMMRFLEGGAQGSSIIVTTRLERVASITSRLPPLRLNVLSSEDCWALFKQYAFGSGNEERDALVKIGEAIVKKCGGLPLAAKAMGGLLRFKNEESEWNEVKDSAVWELPQSSGKDILPALRLSYYHLPSTLKQCFVYCSIFPKDFIIEKETLIQLWMANGLVQSRAKMELEDVGNENFTALLQRSFFQDIEKGRNGGIICKMHDLVHDLASYIAGDEYFVEDVGSAPNITERTHHLSLLSSHGKIPSTSILESMHGSLPCLRSLIWLNRERVTLKFVFSDFILLRALDLHSCEIEVVPDCIGEMIHLRYLNLSGNSFTSLPESICLLRNMQTLNLRCWKLESLPKNLRNMSNLRLLDIERCDRLTEMPIGIAQLTCLRRLSDFIVCEGSRIGELQLLNNLREKLIIRRLGVVETSTEAKEANLMSKKKLHSLDLRWALGPDSFLDSEQQQRHHQNVIEGLQPHSNVRTLSVRGYGGVTFSPSWLTGPNLVKISLSYCTCERLGSLRKLPSLKVLELLEMKSLKFIEEVDDASAGGRGFPSLEELSLAFMWNLEGWSTSSSTPTPAAAVFPCLKSVEVWGCPRLRGIPLAWSPVLQDVKIYGGNCNWMVLGSLRDLPSLPTLTILGFAELEYFPSGALTNLTALHKLEISCNNLKALPVELISLVTLTELVISCCHNLVSLAEEREGGLKNLSSLNINNCRALKRLPEFEKASLVTLIILHCPAMEFSKEDFEHLLVLEYLQLFGLPGLTWFPEGIKHSAATLRHLKFQPFPGLYGAPVDLPDWIVTTLTSLEYLQIDAPRNWKMLPQWMQHLTALKSLTIWKCDKEIVERWKTSDRQREEDYFNMIAHVPDVNLSESIDSWLSWTL